MERDAVVRKYMARGLMLTLMGAAAVGNLVPVSIFFGFDWLWEALRYC